jgi:serine/threonine-protein kinase
MLTGRAPFQAASPVDTVLMVLEQDPPPPRVLNPRADPDLEMIALKALQKPPDLRYASADALADDLQAYLRHEPLAARSSHFSQVLSRAFRPTHHAAVLENWGLLWMWHALVLLVLCVVTNWMQLQGIGGARGGGGRIGDGGSTQTITDTLHPPSAILPAQPASGMSARLHLTGRLPYFLLWTAGLGTWALIFWNLRRRAGPVTFVERQIAHVWAASIACSTLLFAVEALLGLPVLTLSPVLALISAAVFVVKAGILSGEFYLHAAALFATCVPMALWPRYGITIFGLVSAATFLVPGWKFHRQRARRK